MVNNTVTAKLSVSAAAVLAVSCMLLQAQQAPVYPENTPLYFGNPSHAAADVSDEDNYLMEKKQYTLSYSSTRHIPNWVAWHLCAADLGKSGRADTFRADTQLPDKWYHVLKNDYQYARFGFDRGHICPSADRTGSREDNSATFLMTNMVPQAPDSNRIVWKSLEDYERSLVLGGKELYITAGPAGEGGTSGAGTFSEIPVPARDQYGKAEIAEDGSVIYSTMIIRVPSSTWKVILVLPEGTDDISRVTADTQVIAACIPNRQGCGEAGPWNVYTLSVDDLEKLTGYDFLSALPDGIENVIEEKRYF
jgi:endonuclease G, mitochondrial